MTKFYTASNVGQAELFLGKMQTDVLSEWRRRSRSVLYQTEPEAWLWDVLKKRWWSKQSEIAGSVVDHVFTMVKSCNGVGKTQLGGDIVSWFASVFPPEETSILLTAPVREQIDTMMFRYLRENYQLAKDLGNPLLGHITKWPKWVVETPFRKDLVLPKRPADQNLISSFQGVHDTHVLVVMDEAGGLPADMFIAANAVTTNEHARIFGIGNPDRLNTGFHERFKDREKFSDWNVFTIGADDSPNFTGELIYPDDPEKDAWVKARLVQVSWAVMMRKSAPAGVIAAKVDGEFPATDDTTWFDPSTITKAAETKLEPDSGAYKYIGADLSYQGEDQSAMYLNWGGKVRLLETWNRESGTEAIQSARRIHNAAVAHGVTEVRVDKAGTGSGVFSNLITLDEFKDRPYTVIGINGANTTPNINMWLNARAWHYWQMREAMVAGEIDLNLAGETDAYGNVIEPDIALRDELTVQTYEITPRRQYKMTTKEDMRKAGIHSPDHLDAAIYSMIDVTPWTEGAASGRQPGDVIVIDPWETERMTMAGLPI